MARIERSEFAKVMKYLAAGCGKPLSLEAGEVYYDLLGDLPLESLQAAAKRALLEHGYATFPPIALLRQLAVKTLHAPVDRMLAVEAWGTVRWCIARFGWAGGHKALGFMPPLVRQAVECLGWDALCGSKEPEVCRVQFMRAFEALQGRERQDKLLPVSLQASFRSIGMEAIPRSIGKAG